jgi:hypothetical protein
MILCTNCGTKNPDDAANCATCGRKLQSRWALAGQNGQGGQGGANGGGQNGGQNGGGASGLAEPVWKLMEPILRSADDSAGRLVRATAETWFYVLILLGGALATVLTENWWYLGVGLALAAALAWARGI